MSEKSAYKSASYKSAYKSGNDKPNQEQLNTMLEMYLANIIRRNTNESLELESKFGTRGIKPITRIEYDNVIKIKPPMVFSKVHADIFVAALDEALTQLEAA